MDLLIRLAKKVNFTFDVHLSEDGSYGSLRRVSIVDGVTLTTYEVNLYFIQRFSFLNRQLCLINRRQ